MAASDHRARPWPGATARPVAEPRAPGRVARPRPPGEAWWRAYRGPLAVAALAAGAIALTWLASGAALAAAGGALDGARDLDTPRGRAVATTLLAAAALLAFVGRWGSRSSPRRPLAIPGGGRLAVEALEALLRAEIAAVEAVESVRVRVENAHRRGVRVEVLLEVGPTALLSEVAARARELVVDAVERRLALRLAAPTGVELRYGELRLRTGPFPAPGGQAAAAPGSGDGEAARARQAGPGAGEGAGDGRGGVFGRAGE